MKNKTKAIVWMIMSAFSFAIMQLCVKLASDIPVMEKVFFRNLISLIIAAIIIIKTKRSFLGQKENRKYLFLRSLLGYLGVALFFYATNNMQASDAAILHRSSPFFVTIFAFLFLKEKLSKIQVPAMSIAFVGACLVIKPELNSSMLPAIAGLVSAIAAGGAYVFVRFLGEKEDAYTIVFCFSLFSLIFTMPFMIDSFIIPNFYQFILLMGVGISAALGQVLLTLSYKYAPASEVSIYNYMNIVFVAILDYVLLGEIMDAYSVVGAILMIMSSYIVFSYNKKYN